MAQIQVTNEVLTTLSEAPAQSAVAITPDDVNDITGGPVRSLWIGGAGNLSVILVGDSVATLFSGIPAGTLMPLAVKRVMTASTTTLMIGLR